jgi:hypothetical protein
MALLTTQRPSPINLVTPNFQAVSASDTFAAVQGAGQAWMLYYTNGGTATTGAIYVSEKAAVAPAGSLPLVNSAPSTKWSDLQVIATTFPATTSRVIYIDNVDNYVAGGVVNLLHGGTLTTLTVAIFGPF